MTGGGMPRVAAVVQARMSSRRLPGKILKSLAGRPSLDYLLDALRSCQRLSTIVVATSVDASDDPTAAFAVARGLPCHRGSLDDVARRLLDAALTTGADAFVRVNGDSPLLDSRLVDQAVAIYQAGGVEVVSNVHPRSFPKGQSVEVISVAAMRRAVAAMDAAHDREHVTPYIYSHERDFVIRSFQAARPRPELQLSVDSPEDFARCEAIITALDSPPHVAGWQACVDACDALGASRERSA
jgi:spore coat polysaccharide biosynthesis protein SpsF (cytidylyltransferase family)